MKGIQEKRKDNSSTITPIKVYLSGASKPQMCGI